MVRVCERSSHQSGTESIPFEEMELSGRHSDPQTGFLQVVACRPGYDRIHEFYRVLIAAEICSADGRRHGHDQGLAGACRRKILAIQENRFDFGDVAEARQTIAREIRIGDAAIYSSVMLDCAAGFRDRVPFPNGPQR